MGFLQKKNIFMLKIEDRKLLSAFVFYYLFHCLNVLFIKKESSSSCNNDRAKEFIPSHCLSNSICEVSGFTVVSNMKIESLVSVFICISSRLYCSLQIASFFFGFF